MTQSGAMGRRFVCDGLLPAYFPRFLIDSTMVEKSE